MSQAFISYHHAQRKLARLIAHRIAADGHSVWWDRSDRPGDEWSEAVSTALARSACVIVIWSKQAAHSMTIRGEATAGFGRNALVNVVADRTQPPSPFDSAPMVDMADWSGDSIDLAWIRLRDPIRAKMQAAEVKHVEGQALPPQRPPPLPPRISFQNNPGPLLPPPPPIMEEKRGPSAASAFMVLAVGGLAATGWYYRDEVRQEAVRWQAALQPQGEVASIPAPPAPTQPSPQVQAAAPAPEPADAALADPAFPETAPTLTPTDLQPVSQTASAQSAAERAEADRTPTIDDWVPPPVLRQIPRATAEPAPTFSSGSVAQPVAVSPPPSLPAAVSAAPPAPAYQRINLRQGRFVDIDPLDPRRETDIWFSPDRSGDGLYLGVANGSRMRVAAKGAAAAADCARSGPVMRRTPIAARDLARGMSVCVRTSANTLRVVHVEGIEGAGKEKVLRLRLEPR